MKALTHRVFTQLFRCLNFYKSDSVPVSVVVLNFNRRPLLELTLKSLISHGPAGLEIWVVDNASTDDSIPWLKQWGQDKAFVHLILNKKNQGGEALNKALRQCRGKYILISENDLEYLPLWFENLTRPFQAFSNLGLISPLSPFPDLQARELWVTKPHKAQIRQGVKVYEAHTNIGTSALFKRELIYQGLYYRSLHAGEFQFPDDGNFSQQVKRKGLMVAWSEKACVINWGHIESEWKKNPEYYQKNWQGKSQLSIDGLQYVKNGDLEKGIQIHASQAIKTRQRFEQRLTGSAIEEGRLFFDIGKGFNPQSVLTTEWQARAGEVTLQFSISHLKNIQKLRWDPLEGEYIRLDHIQITFKNPTRNFELPASEIKINVLTLDPQVEFKVPHGDWESVEIRMHGFSIKDNL